jgi:hypothetical protein
MSTKPGVGVDPPQLMARWQRRPAERRIERAQFTQRAGPEAREHHEAVGAEQALPARHQLRRVDDGMQHHVGPHQLRRLGQFVGFGHDAHARAAPASGRPPARAQRGPGGGGPGRGRLDADEVRLGIGLRQQPSALAESGPPVDDALRLQPDQRQPLRHAPRDLAVQPRRAGRAGQPAQRCLDRHGVEAARGRCVGIGWWRGHRVHPEGRSRSRRAGT